MKSTAFMALAKCANEKSINFHSDNITEVKEAISFCSTCFVKSACLQYAIDNQIIYGVWGGTSGYARSKLIKQNN
jgi:WhiB family redox-sensing transcriptional regulator